ncbi:erythropoietin receptor [Haliaeetus albicilla]|uniref:erythropoietin receptor n=1 Tax=Haliaeetus albicilla TaxID=8969 RepID=UPI0037E72046
MAAPRPPPPRGKSQDAEPPPGRGLRAQHRRLQRDLAQALAGEEVTLLELLRRRPEGRGLLRLRDPGVRGGQGGRGRCSAAASGGSDAAWTRWAPPRPRGGPPLTPPPRPPAAPPATDQAGRLRGGLGRLRLRVEEAERLTGLYRCLGAHLQVPTTHSATHSATHSVTHTAPHTAPTLRSMLHPTPLPQTAPHTSAPYLCPTLHPSLRPTLHPSLHPSLRPTPLPHTHMGMGPGRGVGFVTPGRTVGQEEAGAARSRLELLEAELGRRRRQLQDLRASGPRPGGHRRGPGREREVGARRAQGAQPRAPEQERGPEPPEPPAPPQESPEPEEGPEGAPPSPPPPPTPKAPPEPPGCLHVSPPASASPQRAARQAVGQGLAALARGNALALGRLRAEAAALGERLQHLRYGGEGRRAGAWRRAEELRQRLGQEQRQQEDARRDLAEVTRALVTASAGLQHLAGRLQHVALVSWGAGGGGLGGQGGVGQDMWMAVGQEAGGQEAWVLGGKEAWVPGGQDKWVTMGQEAMGQDMRRRVAASVPQSPLQEDGGGQPPPPPGDPQALPQLLAQTRARLAALQGGLRGHPQAQRPPTSAPHQLEALLQHSCLNTEDPPALPPSSDGPRPGGGAGRALSARGGGGQQRPEQHPEQHPPTHAPAMPGPGVLLAVGGLLACARGEPGGAGDFEVEAEVLLAEEPRDPKCFSRRLLDLTCFWESAAPPDPRPFRLQYRLECVTCDPATPARPGAPRPLTFAPHPSPRVAPDPNTPRPPTFAPGAPDPGAPEPALDPGYPPTMVPPDLCPRVPPDTGAPCPLPLVPPDPCPLPLVPLDSALVPPDPCPLPPVPLPLVPPAPCPSTLVSRPQYSLTLPLCPQAGAMAGLHAVGRPHAQEPLALLVLPAPRRRRPLCPLELRVLPPPPGPPLHHRTLFIDQVVLLGPPENVSVGPGGARGQLCVRWQPPPSPYLESSLAYELALHAPGLPPRTVGVGAGRREQRVGALRGSTHYSVRARARPDGLSYSGYWSPWSQPATAVTPPDVDPVTLGLSCLLALLLLGLGLLGLLGHRRLLQEKLWPPVPGPEREFEGLFSAYGGNFQLWLCQGVGAPWAPPGAGTEVEELPSTVEEVGPPPGKGPLPEEPPPAAAPPAGPSPASSFEYTLFDPGSALLCPRGPPRPPPHPEGPRRQPPAPRALRQPGPPERGPPRCPQMGRSP